MPLLDSFKADIRRFLKASGLSKTALGLRATGNPQAISLWLSGKRVPRADSMDKLYSFIRKYNK